MNDADDGGTWLTKAEIAQFRHIGITSVEKLIRRQGWRRQPGNDGRVRILVPSDWLHPRYGDPRDGEAEETANPRDLDADPRDLEADPSPMTAFATALTAIETAYAGQIEAMRGELRLSEEGRRAAETRAERTDQDRREAVQRADKLREALERASGEAGRAVQRLEELERADIPPGGHRRPGNASWQLYGGDDHQHHHSWKCLNPGGITASHSWLVRHPIGPPIVWRC